MPFTSLPIAYAGAEGPGGSSTPLAGQPGILAGVRKRGISNASFQLHATNVCQLPNQALTTGVAVPAQSALVICEASAASVAAGSVVLARIWLDGTAPTTITGLPIYAGVPFEIIGQDDLANARIVSADGNQSVLQIQYFSGI